MDNTLHNPWKVWKESALLDIGTALDIIDDALCMGFEFKVSRGTIWFREICS